MQTTNSPSDSLEYTVLTPEMLFERALLEAQNNYHKVRFESGVTHVPVDRIHQKGVCDAWTGVAAKLVESEVKLFDASAEVTAMRWDNSREHALLWFHKFLLVRLTGLEPRIMDGTWQQFLPIRKRSADLPKVLTGSLNEVVDFASSVGVKKRFLPIWSQARPLH